MTAETLLPPVLVLLLGASFGLVLSLMRLARLRAEAAALRRARDAAEEAAHAKDGFLATVSHEVRTPLNAMVGFADLLAATRLDAAQAELVQGIRDGGAHVLAVVGDVLDHSRIEAGRLVLEERSFALEPLVAGCAKVVANAAAAKGLALAATCAPGAPPLLGDATRVRQVLLNLLSNAVKFTPAGSVALAAHARREPDGRVRVELEVSDTGPGIPPQQMRRLFRPFSQLGAVQGGAGLGLAISRHLCQRMGGDILVRSQPGTGSTFTAILRLPEAPADPAAEPAAAATPLRVLLVEDNPMNLRLSRRLLERMGHRVEVATDGAQAVRLATERRPDAVLLDVHMPVMDGLAAARELRRRMPTARPLILGLTASAEDRAACLRAGMDGHLAKPLDPALLAQHLERVARPARKARARKAVAATA